MELTTLMPCLNEAETLEACIRRPYVRKRLRRDVLSVCQFNYVYHFYTTRAVLARTRAYWVIAAKEEICLVRNTTHDG